jgi:hypothetical protein
MLTASNGLPRSGKFQAPGSVPATMRIRDVRDALTGELQAMVADHGFRLEIGADEDERILRRDDLSLPWLCDFVEAGLKRAARRFSADLIGGANVTRLDRSITHGHPRLPYRRALRIVSGRGWRLPLGEDLPAEAQGSLVRFCGLLPVQVIYPPGQPVPASMPDGRQGLSYILPWAGEALRGELPLPGTDGPAVCRFRIDRLLQFILGLDGTDAVRSAALRRDA